MLKKATIQSAFLEKTKALPGLLDDYARNRDPECLHQFRLHLKKIRALFDLLVPDARSWVQLVAFPLLKKTYRQAGRIRAGEIHLALLKNIGQERPELSEQLASLVQLEQKRFIRGIKNAKKLIRRFEKEVAPLFENLDKDRVKSLLKRRRKQLNRYFSRRPLAVEGLHEARIRIKRLLYVKAIFPEKLARQSPLQTDYLKTLEAAIGEWHDAAHTLEWLSGIGFAGTKQWQQIGDRAQMLFGQIEALATDFRQKAW
ncbi:MAG: CHAD domain-containing protein [Saprospiraceae bacterium]|nr:CHAD domain-containing protein [Saprospiraceae bacterium]